MFALALETRPRVHELMGQVHGKVPARDFR